MSTLMMDNFPHVDSIEASTPLEDIQSSESSFLEDFIEDMLADGREIFTLKKIVRTESDEKLLKGHLLNYSRKEKSLEGLSKRFLDLFSQQEKATVELDKISEQLGVQRRRVYDIINILESLKVIVRTAKNSYQWYGVSAIIRTIENYSSVQYTNNIETQKIRKSKSLEVLSIGFLCLFLHWKPKLTLDQAAKKLVGQIQPDKLKTKIRRLYDIANVYKSLGILKKVVLQNKKPGFQWVGIKGLSDLDICSPHTQTIFAQKHSQISTSSSQSQKQKFEPNQCTSSFFAQYLSKSSFELISSHRNQSLLNLIDIKPAPFQGFTKNIDLNAFMPQAFEKVKAFEQYNNFNKIGKEDRFGFRKIQIKPEIF